MSDKKKKFAFTVSRPTTWNNRFYGPAKRELDRETCEALIRQGAGAYDNPEDDTEKVDVYTPPPPASTGNARLAAVAAGLDQQPSSQRALPESFPAKDKLEEAGFHTIESLQVEGIEDKLAEIEGIGKGTITKIGLALNEFSTEEE